MFKFKKTISTVLAFIMALGMLYVPAMAASTEDEALMAKHAEAIDTLKAFEIMIGDDTGAYNAAMNVKRSEFAKIALHTLGLEYLAQGNQGYSKFPDVANDHWAVGYINVAAQQGIIIGDDNGNFRPDDSITYAEATTMLVRMLGYEPSAIAKGGYPTGYLVVGAQEGLSKNVTLGVNEPVKRAQIAQMTFNALTVDLMEQVGFGSSASYEVVDKTILEDKLGIEKIVGQIVATDAARLSSQGSLQNGQVQIDEEIYKTGSLNVRNLLGYNVTAYAKENEAGDKVLVMVRPNPAKNQTLTVISQNMQAFVEGDGKITLEYWVNKDTDKKVSTASIAQDATLIYNGKAADLENLAVPADGRVTLLDTNKDDIYEIVFLTSYENLVVESTSTISYTILDKFGNASLVLDPEDDDIKFTITDKNGNPVDFEDIKEWDVLSYTKSLDGELIDVVVVTDSVSGKVTEISSDGKYTIGGKEYKLAANFEDTISILTEGVFYLDLNGNIAAVDTTQNRSENYAYLVGVTITSGFEEVVKAKLFTLDGKTEVLEFASKAKIDGVKNLEGQAIYNALGGEELVAQLVTFETNAKGEITEIDLALDVTEEGLAYYKNTFVLNLVANNVEYKAATGKLGSIRVTNDTIVLDIPANSSDPTDYKVRNKDMFRDGNKYDIMVYDMNEDLTAGVIIVSNADTRADEASPLAIITKITNVLDENDENVQRLYALVDGKAIEINTEEDDVLVDEEGNALKAGDIIQFSTTVDGKIDKFNIIFRADAENDEFINEVSEDMTLVFGKVDKKFANSINVSINGANVDNYLISDAVIYSVDTTKTTTSVKVANSGDIQKYDPADGRRVFLRIFDGVVREVVIVK
ncbi:MAG: S-layer homology domain-containing protein [Clostridiaceae bacterium]|nr:S-layer homology domain-containing protein [Clostridiaceae bacterium]